MTLFANRFLLPLSAFIAKRFRLRLPLAVALSVFVALISTNSVQAQTLDNFNAQFHVEALGMNLGIAKHQWRCQQQNCTLTSDAKPSGFASLFFKDSSTETVQFKQIDNQLQWQSYYKIGLTEKDGKTVKKITELSIDDNKVICPQKQKQWPIKPRMFDALSIAYGIWHAKLNQQDLTNFVLIDPNFQTDVTLQSQDNQAFIALDFAEDNLDAVKYTYQSPQAKIEIWLMPKYNYFPGKVSIKNQDNKTLTLSLAEPPKRL